MSLGEGLAFSNSNKDKFAGITVVVHEKREREEKKRESRAEESEECLRRFQSRRETIVEIVSEEILCWTSKIEENLIINTNYLLISFLLPFLCLQSQATNNKSNQWKIDQKQTPRLHNTLYITSLVSSHNHGPSQDAEV